VIGAAIMYLSHRALYRRAIRIVAGYPRVLAALRTQRHDGRFGVIVLMCGSVLQALAAIGYSVSIAHWRIPVYAALASLCLYALWRVVSARRRGEGPGEMDRERITGPRVYESRRSMVLLDAARRDAAKRRARELASESNRRSVIYVGEEWECRWWSDRFGVTPAVLKAAVRDVGPMVQDVERYFAARRQRAAYAFAA
jgi:hypothetical protein